MYSILLAFIQYLILMVIIKIYDQLLNIGINFKNILCIYSIIIYLFLYFKTFVWSVCMSYRTNFQIISTPVPYILSHFSVLSFKVNYNSSYYIFDK